jgi:hypothetical protein
MNNFLKKNCAHFSKIYKPFFRNHEPIIKKEKKKRKKKKKRGKSLAKQSPDQSE